MNESSIPLSLVALPMVAALVAAGTAWTTERVDSEVGPLSQPDSARSVDGELKFDYSVTPLVEVVLPPPDRSVKRTAPPPKGRPYRIGFHRDLPRNYRGDTSGKLYWFSGTGGTVVGAMSVASPGAAAMRIAIRPERLAGGEIRFFGKNATQRFPIVTEADVRGQHDESGVLWSPVVKGDMIGVEIVLPRSALSSFSFAVAKISHIETDVLSSSRTKQTGCANHIDVQCRDDEIRAGVEDAVARYLFEEDPYTLACTGTLLNDTREDTFVPYFITAAHCVSSTSAARTVAVSWFYQRAACGDGDTDERYAQSAGGADLLATSPDNDATLLRLKGRLPDGLTFAGWNAEPLEHPTAVYGIHHPVGYVKKFSGGSTRGFVELAPGLPIYNGIVADWHEGVTEGGSSGSGLFRRDDGTLVGTLSGGLPGCHVGEDIYGSFAGFFPVVRRWLAPDSATQDDHPDDAATATVVVAGSATPGILESNLDVDYFSLELDTAGTIRVATAGTTATTGTLVRDDDRLKLEDDGGGAGNFLIEGNVPAGVYYIEVKGTAEATGAYTLEVSVVPLGEGDDHGDTRSTATAVAAAPSTTMGSLDWDRDLDYFRIELAEDGSLSVASTGGTDTEGTLMGGNGAPLAADDDAGEGVNFLIGSDRGAGTYFVEVRGHRDAATGPYALEVAFEPGASTDDHGDTVASASELPAESRNHAGSLEREGDADYFRIGLTEDSTLWVETTGGLDTRLILLDADGEVLREDAHTADVDSVLADDLDAGTYYLVVRGASARTTGRYGLRVRIDSRVRGGTLADTPMVAVPSTTDGDLVANATELFRVELDAPGVFAAWTTGQTDTTGTLRGADGTSLATDDDGGDGANFRIERGLHPGTYYVEVGGHGEGAYSLNLSHDAWVPDAPVVEVPSVTARELESDEARNYYRLDLDDPGRLLVATTGYTDTVGSLHAWDGALLAEDDDGGLAANFRIQREVRSGTYYVEVQGEAGDYSLVVRLDPPAFADAGTVDIPSSTDGVLALGGQNFHRVDVAEPGMLRVGTSGGTDTVGSLIDATGSTVGHDEGGGDHGNFLIERIIAVPGTFYVGVRGRWGLPGPYTLDVSFDPGFATPVAAGSSTPAKFEDVDDVDYFRVELTDPGTLNVGTAGDVDTVGTLLDANGTTLAENDDSLYSVNFAIERTLDAGTYYVRVAGHEPVLGSYELRVAFRSRHRLRSLPDLDGDGAVDVLLRHEDGRWSFHRVEGRRVLEAVAADPTRSRDWRLAGLADLDGDGGNDIVLRHRDGRWFRHPMDGPRSLAEGRGAARITPGTNWHVAGFGDFGGDGRQGVILRGTDGRWRHFRMDGLLGTPVAVGIDPPADLRWQFVGIGDFDGDGADGMLLRHTEDGRWRLYRLAAVGQWTGVQAELDPDPAYRFVGIGDLNGDGRDDVLVRHREGRWRYDPMDGHRVVTEEAGAADLSDDPAWRLAAIGDLNGDGNEDVLLRHRDGSWHFAAMNGAASDAGASGSLDLPSDLAWSIPPLPVPDSDRADGVLFLGDAGDGRQKVGRLPAAEGRGR